MLKKGLSFIVFIAVTFSYFAQPSVIERKRKPYTWMYAIGWNVVNDGESTFANLFDYSRTVEFLPFPSRFCVTKYIRKKWSFEGMASYNSLRFAEYEFVPVETKDGIVFDTTTRYDNGVLVATDFVLKYNFRKTYPPLLRFDPYISFGAGASYRSKLDMPLYPTVNAAIGVNLWMTRHLAFQLQTMGKLSFLRMNSLRNYMALSASFVYCVRYRAPKHLYNGNRNYKWATNW